MLNELGLTEVEMEVYRANLTFGDGVVDLVAVAALTGRNRAQVSATADRLVTEHRLLYRDLDERLRVVPPDVALPALMQYRHALLTLSRPLVEQLVGIYRLVPSTSAPAAAAQRPVEGLPALVERAQQLQTAAREEVCWLVRPPYLLSLAEFDYHKLVALMGNQVAYRVVYTPEVLTEPANVLPLRSYAKLGEQARTAPAGLATNLLLVDRCHALLVDVADPDADPVRGLLVSHGAVVAALVDLFEASWRTAIRVNMAPTGEQPPGRLTEDDLRLLVMLAAGSKDVAIGRQLGCHSRTVQRRVEKLREDFGARSRSELLMILARIGLIGADPTPVSDAGEAG